MLTTSFTMNEWESEEEEDSNSSEEFFYTYTRGNKVGNTNGFTEINLSSDMELQNREAELEKNILWSTHKDQIQVASTMGKLFSSFR